MPKRNQFVVPHPEGWAVKKEGSNRATAIFQNQQDAIEYGRDLAITQRCELVIHDRKGEVRKRRNYKHPRHAVLRRQNFLREFYESRQSPLEQSQQSLETALDN